MNIVLVDDHFLFAQSLKVILSNKFNVETVYTFNSLADYVSNKKVQQPDLIILDLIMPGADGFEALKYFRKQYGDNPKILILSFISNIQVIKTAFKSGANGFVSKSAGVEEFIEAVDDVKNGNLFLEKKLREEAMHSIFTQEHTLFNLSEKEHVLLQHVCNGLTLKEIAFEMKVSYHSAQYYYKTVMKKLNLKRNAELIVFAMTHGLYRPEISGNLK